MRKLYVIILCCITMMLSACGKNEESHTATNEQIMKAMYVTFGEDLSVFIGQEDEAVFYGNFPEDIYNIKGEKITKDQLEKGNIIQITGNGVMAESYPGQYYGITKMEVIEEGSPGDADQFQYIIDQIYQEPDLSQPPELSISYKTEIAAVNFMASTDSNLIDAVITEPTDMMLHFSREPESVFVDCWQGEVIQSEDGESITVTSGDDGWMMTAKPGYAYRIRATWEETSQEFGFYTPMK